MSCGSGAIGARSLGGIFEFRVSRGVPHCSRGVEFRAFVLTCFAPGFGCRV